MQVCPICCPDGLIPAAANAIRVIEPGLVTAGPLNLSKAPSQSGRGHRARPGNWTRNSGSKRLVANRCLFFFKLRNRALDPGPRAGTPGHGPRQLGSAAALTVTPGQVSKLET